MFYVVSKASYAISCRLGARKYGVMDASDQLAGYLAPTLKASKQRACPQGQDKQIGHGNFPPKPRM